MKQWPKLLSSVNLLTTLMLLGALFIMVNFIASRRYARLDLSRQKITALSEKTRQTLRALKAPLSVIVFYQPSHRLYELVNDTLEEYARACPQIRIERVDPQQDVARARQLIKTFEIDVSSPEALNLVIFQHGGHHKYLSDTSLAEYDYDSMGLGTEPRVKAFKGEDAFTSAIISVTQETSPLVWCVTGHGEKALESTEPEGWSDAKKTLEQQNMTLKTVTLLERTEIPAEVKLLIIPGPTRRLTDSELALLQTYVDRGGRVLALIDPLDNTGLDGLLERWGIRLGLDIVVDPAHQLPFVSAANLFVTTYTQHPIVQKMKTLMTLFPLARSVSPVKPAPEGLQVTPLALTSEAGWGETKTSDERFQFNPGEDVKGPVSIAVACERPAPRRARLVVIGDSDFAVNAQLANVGNRDLLLGAVYWLIEQEQLIGIGPKPLESLKLHLTSQQLSGVSWFSFLALPMTFGVLGAGVWLLRRQ